MKRRIAAIALSILILIPFLINLLGWNIYFYINLGANDLIFASAVGVSHNAWAEHIELDETLMDLPLLEDHSKTILDAGPIELFLERRGDPMTPLTFRWISADEYSDYRGFEFPWLLMLGAPIAILYSNKLKRRRSPTEKEDTEAPSTTNS